MLKTKFCSYNEDPEVLDLCTFLDPRVKAMPYMSLQEKEVLRDLILDLCVKDASSSVSTPLIEPDTMDTAASTKSSGESHQPLAGLLSGMYSSAQQDTSASATASIVEIVSFELRRYMQQPSCNMSVCPLTW